MSTTLNRTNVSVGLGAGRIGEVLSRHRSPRDTKSQSKAIIAPVFVTPKGDLTSMVGSASKVGKGSLTKVFTGRTFFAVGTKESIFTLTGGFGIA